MKICVYFCALFFGLINQAFSQSADSIFDKDIFIVRSYGRTNFVKPKSLDTIKPAQKSFNVRVDDGPIRYSVLPDPGKWRIALYINDRLDNECYYYKDIFIIPNFNDGHGSAEVDDFIRSEIDANKVFLKGINGKVVKMWRIKAQWKKETVKEKPDWFKGRVSPFLEFDEYNIYTLHHVISMKAITSNEGDNSVTVGKNVLLGASH